MSALGALGIIGGIAYEYYNNQPVSDTIEAKFAFKVNAPPSVVNNVQVQRLNALSKKMSDCNDGFNIFATEASAPISCFEYTPLSKILTSFAIQDSMGSIWTVDQLIHFHQTTNIGPANGRNFNCFTNLLNSSFRSNKNSRNLNKSEYQLFL